MQIAPISVFHERADLLKLVVENEKETDGLWCQNKYMKTFIGQSVLILQLLFSFLQVR